MAISIRSLNEDDATTISELALRSKSHWNYTGEQMAVFREELTFTKKELRSRIAFGLDRAGVLIGFYTLVVESSLAELEHIFIDPDYLLRGFGTALMKHAIDYCKANEIVEMTILSDPHAAGFYAAIGAKLQSNVPSSIPGRSILKFMIDCTTQ